MPKEAATIAEVLRHYGYKTSAFWKVAEYSRDENDHHGTV